MQSHHGTSPAGASARAVRWLLGGLALTALVILATAPELLGEGLGMLALVSVAAGVPGLVVVLVLAARRRRTGAAPAAASDAASDADGHRGRDDAQGEGI